MVVTFLEIKIELYETGGLKYRRKIANSIKERLKKLNLSLLDTSSEYTKEIELTAVFLSPDNSFKEKTKANPFDSGKFKSRYHLLFIFCVSILKRL